MSQTQFKTLLAFDCSTEVLSLALQTSDNTVHVRQLQGGAQSSQAVLAELGALLHEAKTPWSAVDVLVCGRGPGAFTGVRVTMAVAQGLALACSLPVFAVSGLLAIAEQARVQCLEANTQHDKGADAQGGWQVLALLDARMGQMYAADCHWQAGRWQHGPEQLLDYAALAAYPGAEEKKAIAGNVRSALVTAHVALPNGRKNAPQDAQPCAAALLRVALQEIAAGAQPLTDPAALSPVYVRDKVAQTTAERAAQKTA